MPFTVAGAVQSLPVVTPIFRVITWNLAARSGRVKLQAAALLERAPDAVTLQEVKSTTVASLLDELASGGLHHALVATPDEASKDKSRQICVVMASRFPLERLSSFTLPWPEKALGARIQLADRAVDVFTVHMPPGANHGWFKVECFQAVYAALATPCSHARVLTGDFNSPIAELPTGQVMCSGMRLTRDGRWIGQRSRKGNDGQQWADGENLVFTGLHDHDLHDVFRRVHGWELAEFSIEMRWRSTVTRRRFDHIFASHALQPVSCAYLHALRTSGLSDHSALEATFIASNSPTPVRANH